jgi:hypothetical protein
MEVLVWLNVNVNLSLYKICQRGMKTHGGVNVRLHPLLISALDGDEWSVSQPGLSTGEATATLTLEETE